MLRMVEKKSARNSKRCKKIKCERESGKNERKRKEKAEKM